VPARAFRSLSGARRQPSAKLETNLFNLPIVPTH
jgi:hypothetical protein